jgi:hypothetical protein
MGGNLMMRILDEGWRSSGGSERNYPPAPVRSCQKSAGIFRAVTIRITAEDMVYEEGKYYIMMKAVHGRTEEDVSSFSELWPAALLTAAPSGAVPVPSEERQKKTAGNPGKICSTCGRERQWGRLGKEIERGDAGDCFCDEGIMKCSEIMEGLKKQWPETCALDWDNVGLLVGREERGG